MRLDDISQEIVPVSAKLLRAKRAYSIGQTRGALRWDKQGQIERFARWRSRIICTAHSALNSNRIYLKISIEVRNACETTNLAFYGESIDIVHATSTTTFLGG